MDQQFYWDKSKVLWMVLLPFSIFQFGRLVQEWSHIYRQIKVGLEWFGSDWTWLEWTGMSRNELNWVRMKQMKSKSHSTLCWTTKIGKSNVPCKKSWNYHGGVGVGWGNMAVWLMVLFELVRPCSPSPHSPGFCTFQLNLFGTNYTLLKQPARMPINGALYNNI